MSGGYKICAVLTHLPATARDLVSFVFLLLVTLHFSGLVVFFVLGYFV